ncbi:MAG: sortase [Clostridia bacterium]|nr:sortase [Clostridia bacterium]
MIRNIKEKEKENILSNTISLNAKLNSVFSYREVKEESIYFGRIICEKIDLDDYIYNEYSEENLKILPCKFSGGTLEEDGNICIIGHNYYDNRFFSNLNKLEIGDTIVIKDLEEKTYEYKVYQKYEINQSDTEKVTRQEVPRELTLCTCTYDKEKRFVVKAEGKNFFE